MIQNMGEIEPHKEQEELSKQILQYKRINASLKKKIQARDRKINYLFSCLDTVSKSGIRNSHNPEQFHRNSSEIQFSTVTKRQYPKTDPRKKEKQNVNHNSNNIFKERNLQYDKFQINESLKLPALQKKSVFLENSLSSIHNLEGSEFKPKVIRISKEKLVPLKSEQIKRKFEKKFNRQSEIKV